MDDFFPLLCGCGAPLIMHLLAWAGLGWVGLGWAELGWAGLGWAGFSSLSTTQPVGHPLRFVMLELAF